MTEAQANFIAMVCLLVVTPAVTLYPFFYAIGSRRARWWKYDVGRTLFVKGISLMLLVDLSLTFTLLGRPAPAFVRMCVFLLVCIAINYQFIVLLRNQHEGRVARRKKKEEVKE
jgi:hypothetical protein